MAIDGKLWHSLPDNLGRWWHVDARDRCIAPGRRPIALARARDRGAGLRLRRDEPHDARRGWSRGIGPLRDQSRDTGAVRLRPDRGVRGRAGARRRACGSLRRPRDARAQRGDPRSWSAHPRVRRRRRARRRRPGPRRARRRHHVRRGGRPRSTLVRHGPRPRRHAGRADLRAARAGALGRTVRGPALCRGLVDGVRCGGGDLADDGARRVGPGTEQPDRLAARTGRVGACGAGVSSRTCGGLLAPASGSTDT